jgi:hypothetical protein
MDRLMDPRWEILTDTMNMLHVTEPSTVKNGSRSLSIGKRNGSRPLPLLSEDVCIAAWPPGVPMKPLDAV